MDWTVWHEKYDEPNSGLARRLVEVQRQVRAALDTAPGGSLRVLSLCAGQGRDLIGPLADHPRRHDVTALLVEIDERLAATARARAESAGLDRVTVLTGDAARTDNYADMVPADLVLLCGIFGNIADADIEATVDQCPALVRPGGTVIWTRNRRPADLVPMICEWFERRNFVPVSPPTVDGGVAAHRFTGASATLETGRTLFRFIRYE
jgi:hypothetical protein